MAITVLCINPVYLPGIKYGGPVRTLSNMVEALGDEVTFKVVAAILRNPLPCPVRATFRHVISNVTQAHGFNRSNSVIQAQNAIDSAHNPIISFIVAANQLSVSLFR